MPPKYRQIAAELRDRIISGHFATGDRLPTEQRLMDDYGVSRNTVRLATALLVNEGLIERVPGRLGGMLVRAQLMLTYHASRAEMPHGLWPESDAWFGEVQAQGYQPSQRFEMRIAELPAELAERLASRRTLPPGCDAASAWSTGSRARSKTPGTRWTCASRCPNFSRRGTSRRVRPGSSPSADFHNRRLRTTWLR